MQDNKSKKILLKQIIRIFDLRRSNLEVIKKPNKTN